MTTMKMKQKAPVLAAVLAFLSLAVSGARAEITVIEANYSAGVLLVRGETSQANQRVTLDGRYTEYTDKTRQFVFRIRYLPRDCTAEIRAGQESRPAYVANCEPAVVVPLGQTNSSKGAEIKRGTAPDTAPGTAPNTAPGARAQASALRIVRQGCERGNECRVVCREREVALNAFCSGGAARLIGERTVSCAATSPSEIVAYCMSR